MKQIIFNNQPITFTRCLKGSDSKIETNIWKTFIDIDNNLIEFEVINECEICDSKLHPAINWEAINDFLIKLPNHLKKLKSESQEALLFLAQKMKFLENHFTNKTHFYLDVIDYLSVNLTTKELKYSRFDNHTFLMIFAFEDNDNLDIDIYGRWITKWIGNQLISIYREV
jgi:hypothetical protein